MKLSNLVHHAENGDMMSKDFAGLVREEHKLRYRIASESAIGKIVLDVGCGYGYGVNLLAHKAKYVVGVERDENAIRIARARYRSNNLEFVDKDFYEFGTENHEKFDMVTCFEVIEHVPDQGRFMNMLTDSLSPSGRIFISTPNAKYTTFYRKNPYHLKEFSLPEIESLMGNKFRIDLKLGFLPGSLVMIPLPFDVLARLLSLLCGTELVMPTDRPETSRTMLLSGVKL